jgi:hypothetical protein
MRRCFSLPAIASAALVLSLAVASPAAGSAARSYSDDETLGSTLNKIAREIEEHPGDYLERSERAWLMLEHGMTGAPVAEDIDTLLTKPAWHGNASRLRAWHLYQLGRHDEAAEQARKNLAAGYLGPEQFDLLAGIALARNDTLGARSAHREGWERTRSEESFISQVQLSRKDGIVSEALLAAGLRAHPLSPGIHAAIFKAHMENAATRASVGAKNSRAASLREAIAISGAGQAVLWPHSVDWKLRHARAHIAAGRSDSAEAALMRAMELIENDDRLAAGTAEGVRLRHEIFTLLDSVPVRR